ncbi:hypothetical protein ER308_16640 [Egibacter rhizosphaerae]|uniref:Uncharacterized protein n=1 Tax=Egibacter rhizosphaerae TaxID=1670831 RepID=A0A411YIU0_9ACTN|nr:hypothetical protein [Egibacter rhizosphaerae]QBI21039.1 hypothetical protein ER308_16640 [Egibacter rhizosphaerae]
MHPFYERFYGVLSFNPRCAVSSLSEVLPDLLAEIWAVVERELRPVLDLEEVQDQGSVTRVDIARDFSIESKPEVLIEALRRVPRPRASMLRVFSETETGEASTLYVGTKTAGTFRVYDSGFRRSKTLRVELQARKRGWLTRYGGIKAPCDLTAAKATDLFLNRWDHARMGAWLYSPRSFLDAIAKLDLDPRTEDALIADMYRQINGRQPSRASATRKKYRDLLDQVGGAPVLDGRGARRLDLESGVEIQSARPRRRR